MASRSQEMTGGRKPRRDLGCHEADRGRGQKGCPERRVAQVKAADDSVVQIGR
jgi:hypothetical protein